MTVHYRELVVSQEATLLSEYIWKYEKLDGDTLKNRSIRLKPSIHVNLNLQIMCKKKKKTKSHILKTKFFLKGEILEQNKT